MSGTWIFTNNLNTGRYAHTATLLPNGTILVAGGQDRNHTTSTSAELYDPVSKTWTTTGNLNTERQSHTATLLPNGTVLVTGGTDSSFPRPTSSAELYDPASGTWTITGSLNAARVAHTATLLSNGMVLVAGGVRDVNAFASAELYNPATGTWTFTGSLNTGRYFHTATLLPNGMVLVAAGESTQSNASFPAGPDELFLVTGCSAVVVLSSGERRTLHSRTSPNTNPDANTNTNPQRQRPHQPQHQRQRPLRLLRHALGDAHRRQGHVPPRDRVRSLSRHGTQGEWTLETDRELAVYHEGNHRHVVTSHAIRLTNR